MHWNKHVGCLGGGREGLLVSLGSGELGGTKEIEAPTLAKRSLPVRAQGRLAQPKMNEREEYP